MRGVWPTGDKAKPAAGQEDRLLVREREILKFMEQHGLEKDAQLCRERLEVMLKAQ